MIVQNYEIVGGYNSEGVAVNVITRTGGDDEFMIEVFDDKICDKIVALLEKDIKIYEKKNH